MRSIIEPSEEIDQMLQLFSLILLYLSARQGKVKITAKSPGGKAKNT